MNRKKSSSSYSYDLNIKEKLETHYTPTHAHSLISLSFIEFHSIKKSSCFHYIFLSLVPKGVDIRFDAGFSLALAFWSRSAVLLDLNRGSNALDDIQCAIDNGLDDLKKQHEYYARLAIANARKLNG